MIKVWMATYKRLIDPQRCGHELISKNNGYPGHGGFQNLINPILLASLARDL